VNLETKQKIRKIRSATYLVSTLLAIMTTLPGVAADFKLSTQPARLVNGSAAVFQVVSSRPLAELHGRWLGHDVLFFSRDRGTTWTGLVGAAMDTKKGSYPLELEARRRAGGTLRWSKGVRVWLLPRKTVVLTTLTVPERFTSPDAATLARIESEKALKAKIFHEVTPEPQWSGQFEVPLESEVTENFGARRVFNGVVKSEHHGTDFRAATGTRLVAANRGRVVLARELFYEGNCIVLDHGQGWLTIYMHLSEIDIHEGDVVARGASLGETGASGRVTGPHLHLSVLWQGTAIDPMSLIALKLPSQP
jgi:murein DD-endopeptidase MepM/ murein hydrolase activator NlpD